jgi:hypothetical protein
VHKAEHLRAELSNIGLELCLKSRVMREEMIAAFVANAPRQQLLFTSF